jgi:hypothetical protein
MEGEEEEDPGWYAIDRRWKARNCVHINVFHVVLVCCSFTSDKKNLKCIRIAYPLPWFTKWHRLCTHGRTRMGRGSMNPMIGRGWFNVRLSGKNIFREWYVLMSVWLHNLCDWMVIKRILKCMLTWVGA